MMAKKSKKAAILLMGLPGIGKGTQAFLLEKRLGKSFKHFDTGKEIKLRLKKKAPKGQEETYRSGALNDPSWVIKIVKEGILPLIKKGHGVIFSGSPRTLPEAEFLAKFLIKRLGKEKVFVFLLEADKTTVEGRILGRLVCKNDTCRFNVKKEDGHLKCPVCGSDLGPKEIGPEATAKRFEEYENLTVPAIEHLSRHFRIYEINAEQTEEEILMDILDHLSPM